MILNQNGTQENLKPELTEQDNLIAQIINALQGKVAGYTYINGDEVEY